MEYIFKFNEINGYDSNAVLKIKNGSNLTEEEIEQFLKFIVTKTREKLNTITSDSSYTNMCDRAQSIIGEYLNLFNIKYAAASTNKTLMEGIVGHSFIIATLNDKEYLIDPTYKQFCLSDNCNQNKYLIIENKRILVPSPGFFIKDEDKNTIEELLSNGYLLANENNMRIYGDSFLNTLRGVSPDTPFKTMKGSIYLKSFLKGDDEIKKI